MDLLTRPIKAGSVNAITPGRALCVSRTKGATVNLTHIYPSLVLPQGKALPEKRWGEWKERELVYPRGKLPSSLSVN